MRGIKITLLLIALVGCTTIMYSCKKDNNHASSDTVYNGSKVTFQKRWNFLSTTSARPALNNNTNSNYAHRPAAGDTSYTAIEFTIDSTYIVFYSDGNLQVGQYLAKNDTTLTLDSLGTITIKSLTANTFNFVLQPDSSLSSITFSTTVAPTYSFSSASDSALVSNTWIVDSVVVPGNPPSVLLFTNDSLKELDVNWSAYGTDLGRFIYYNGTETYSVSTWLWSDDSHQSFCYSNWEGLDISNCSYESKSEGGGIALASKDSIIFSNGYTQLELNVTDSLTSIATAGTEYLHKK
ncbi:MAG TPA: hypothetical protein VK705_06555 [Ferruginibacter sp.]|nr:hypothetical protein [Ferruginibacter sp.]